MDKYIGKRLDGRYEIEEVIGIGGMAVVYKAHDVANNMTVAVKIMKDEYIDNEEFCRRFRNESRAIALLSHKNIVKVFDVYNTPKLQYLVMEYIDGITLKEYIEQQHVLSWKEAVHFTTQILKALQHAHDKGVIHRDIKPQNIMLLENGDIKVTDFGIARFARSETRTITDKAIGSVHYIAPEQARGGNTDARSDVYSVGVMMYEMLTGKLPFEAENAVSVAVMQMQADPKMPRDINPSIPEGLEEITMQAMQKDPVNRYQTASDMLIDIDDFKKDPGIRFEYRYMIDDSPTRYMNAINNTKRLQEEEIQNEKSPVIPVLAGISAAFMLIALIFGWLVLDASGLTWKNNSTGSMLPNFINQEYSAIVNDPSYQYQFKIEWVFNSLVPENYVVEQTPKPGKTVYSDTVVTLMVSKGVERLMVPDFTNMDFASYSQQIIELNVTYKKIEVYNDTVPENYIINTNPLPRADIAEGDVIEVYVSIGPKPDVLVMPNCQNMTYDQAKTRLAAMGITSISIDEVESDKPQGTVLSQEPGYGTTIVEGMTTVRLTVSNGVSPNKQVNLTINMPANVVYDMHLDIKIDDVVVHSATVNATLAPQYVVTLAGSGVKTAKVYLGGYQYQDIKIDFSSGAYVVTKDYGFVATTAPTTTTTTAPAEVVVPEEVV